MFLVPFQAPDPLTVQNTGPYFPSQLLRGKDPALSSRIDSGSQRGGVRARRPFLRDSADRCGLGPSGHGMVDLFFASVSSLAPLEREVRVGPGLALGKSLHFSMSQFPHPQKEGAHRPPFSQVVMGSRCVSILRCSGHGIRYTARSLNPEPQLAQGEGRDDAGLLGMHSIFAQGALFICILKEARYHLFICLLKFWVWRDFIRTGWQSLCGGSIAIGRNGLKAL